METIKKFLEYLDSKKDDRGIMANLRRGLSPATQHYAWPYIAPWCDINNNKLRSLYLLIAGGFAYCRKSKSTGNIGTVCRIIALGSDKKDGLNTFEARFRRLITCGDYSDLYERLIPIIKTCAVKDIPINFEQLFKDIYYWNEQAKIKWASEYWATKSKEAEEVIK